MIKITFKHHLSIQYNTNFIPLSYIEHVKHEAYVQKSKYLCSVMAAIEKKQQHTLTLTHQKCAYCTRKLNHFLYIMPNDSPHFPRFTELLKKEDGI